MSKVEIDQDPTQLMAKFRRPLSGVTPPTAGIVSRRAEEFMGMMYPIADAPLSLQRAAISRVEQQIHDLVKKKQDDNDDKDDKEEEPEREDNDQYGHGNVVLDDLV